MNRKDWLEEHGATEEGVFRDAQGEYIHMMIRVSDSLTSFPKLYLPEEIQNHGKE